MPITGPLVDSNYALIAHNTMKSGRKINNSIVPDVVIEEIVTDTVRITDHPVEIGCAISDHAFKLPIEIVMRCGWSDSAHNVEGYVAGIWEWFIELQNNREPFSITTPKRTYENMLVSFLNVTEDEETSHALRINIGFKEVIITSTSSSPGPQSVGTVSAFQNNSLPAIVQLFGGNLP